MKWGYVRHAESNLFNPFIKVCSRLQFRVPADGWSPGKPDYNLLEQMHENTDPKLLKINLSDLHHIKTIGKGCFSTIWLVKFDKKYFALKIYEKLKITQLRRVFISPLAIHQSELRLRLPNENPSKAIFKRSC